MLKSFGRYALCLLLVGLFALGATSISSGRPVLGGIKSVWYVGSDQSAFTSTQIASELARLKAQLQVNTVSLIVPLFQEDLKSSNPHLDSARTPTDAQVRRVIDQAHLLGLHVMLLPFLTSDDGHWVGELQPGNVKQWFQRWRALLNHYAALAQGSKVEIFLIGWEFESLLSETDQWETATAQVRENYSGLVSYLTNFWADRDEYQRVLDWSPWEELDFIGISAFFELTRHGRPTVEELRQAWHEDANGQDIIEDLAQLNDQYGRCIAFWELGYESKEGTAQYPWNFLQPGAPDEGEQSNAFLAAFQALSQEGWFAGYSVWSEKMGLPTTDVGYEILGKMAELTIRTHQLAPRTCQDAR
ncbi:hypothetical protein HY009_07320 [Candidatus Acetothermia bacterium]|nr:hypothetical protein [Candidatus Acetothermia bacterium]